MAPPMPPPAAANNTSNSSEEVFEEIHVFSSIVLADALFQRLAFEISGGAGNLSVSGSGSGGSGSDKDVSHHLAQGAPLNLGATPSDATLAAIAYAFPDATEKGIDIAQKGQVAALVAQQSKRRVYQVASSGRAGSFGGAAATATTPAGAGSAANAHPGAHTCLPRELCTCYKFTWDVAFRNEAAMCKHQLAVRAAEAMRTVRNVTTIQDEDMAAILGAL
ncbi:hypothetical protein PPROV_000057400 [Pycnococcus provasolii]|uniref:SWIM-type domain-containing protein n=1 Tax=Pycnococcus provasolii TaxID=41880 RepID=A0A6T5WUI0_9CHLO|nr:hypothetical protein PPROV_000057400 [Pycnococcus provasolii]|mmetsp:Transcript_1146/g.2537  ORF Transcript_1146/g.2537 Transcript_1146/m.2537 type:complete len:220 (+) Transcript_1146:31-690(+)